MAFAQALQYGRVQSFHEQGSVPGGEGASVFFRCQGIHEANQPVYIDDAVTDDYFVDYPLGLCPGEESLQYIFVRNDSLGNQSADILQGIPEFPSQNDFHKKDWVKYR
jgi:hypothetical protein